MRVTEHTDGSVSIAYEIVGVGPLVVFLHGLGGSRASWKQQLDALSDQYCVVAWDSRGTGDSDDPPTELQFSDFADDLRRLLDHLGVERAHLVGQSMGALTIQDFCARHLERVATVTLSGTNPGLAALGEETKRRFLQERLEPLERGLSLADSFRSLVPRLLGPSAPTSLREELLERAKRIRKEPYLQMMRAIATTDFRAALPKITVPALVLVGEQDRIAPPSIAHDVAAHIPDAEKVVIAASGHIPNCEQPQVFNTVIRAFLQKHAERATSSSVSNRK
jgi:pimeloyl-ACP methyl ester carboxylesterase